jgi:hypothetical protein
MKYVCLGYMEEAKWSTVSEGERNRFLDECFAYDDELRTNGHFIDGEALQPASTAATIRLKNGQVAITDGPYAETKEQLGGIMILEATDFNHAVQLMSRHPSIRMGGSFEVRPAGDLSAMIAESMQRRNAVVK